MKMIKNVIHLSCLMSVFLICSTTSLFAQTVLGIGEDMSNDFSKNDEWYATIADEAAARQKLIVDLANQGLKELDLPELQHRDDIQDPIDKYKYLSEKELEKDVGSRNHVRFNSSAFPRATYEIINLELTDTFEGTCHIPFRDVYSSDKGEQFKYFASPLVFLTSNLIDLPRVAIKQMKNQYCTGTSCAQGGATGGSSGNDNGVFHCFKNDKQFVSIANLIQPVKDYLPSEAEISYLEKNELFPDLQAQDDTKKVCVDFAGKRLWSGYSTMLPGPRHVVALHQALDSYEYFQHLSTQSGSSGSGGGSADTAAKLPIGHTIVDKDRFYGQYGNFALKVAEDGSSCPTATEMAKQSMEFGKEANALDMATSGYQSFGRYMAMKCGGGQNFRGYVLKSDKSETMCQTDSNAKPYDGEITKYWDFEIPYKSDTVVPSGETRVC